MSKGYGALSFSSVGSLTCVSAVYSMLMVIYLMIGAPTPSLIVMKIELTYDSSTFVLSTVILKVDALAVKLAPGI